MIRHILKSFVSSAVGQKRNRRRHHAFGFRPERLESRTLLTGNVNVLLSGPHALVFGDNGDNSIEVVADNGNIIARGLNGTTINGGTEIFTLASGTSTFSGQFLAWLGKGNDTLTIGSGLTFSRSIMIDGQAGDDTLGVSGVTLRDNLNLYGSFGTDGINVQDTTIGGSLTVLSHDSATVHISGTTIAGRLYVDTGKGADTIVVDTTTIGRNAFFTTGRGDDDIVIRNSTLNGKLDVFSGKGNDVVFIDSTSVQGNSWFWMQKGNDNVQIQGTSTFSRKVRVLGGRGSDAVEVAPEATVATLKRFSTPTTQVDDALIANRITNASTGAIARAKTLANRFLPGLTVSVSANSIVENAGPSAATLTVTRPGSTANSVVVTLTSSNPARATVPATVTIPAGAASATVSIAAVDNSTFDPDATVTITATATQYRTATNTLVVTSEDVAALTLTSSINSVNENAGANAVTLTVSRNSSENSLPLVITLSSSPVSRLTVPATVTIPANQTSITFSASPVNNSTLDGNANVTITATAGNFTSATKVIEVIEDDAAALTLTSLTSTIAENAGANALSFTVTRNNASLSQDLIVTLASDTPTRLTIPATVTIPAGSDSVSFFGTPVNNAFFDGSATVRVTATATALTAGERQISVTDDETAALGLSTSETSIAENTTGPGVSYTLTRFLADTSSDLVVSLQTTNSSRLTVPASVTIPAGQTSVQFFATPVNNSFYDGNVDVNVIATTSTLPAAQSATLTIIEDESPPAPELTLSITPTEISENGAANSITLSVFRQNSDRTNALVVDLVASDSSRISVPATITIPALQFSASTTLSPIDNLAVDGPLDVSITASATGFASKTSNLRINDNENAVLSISLPDSQVSENSGVQTATISTSVVSSSDIVVQLTYSSPVVTGPASIVIPAGQNSASVDVTVVPGIIIDQSVVVKIRGTAIGAVGASFDLTVNDTDTLQLTTDISTNTTVPSNGTVITRDNAFTITGVTAGGATVEADVNGDGIFDEASTIAAPDGTYTLTVSLIHSATNFGANNFIVRSMLGADSADAIVSAHLAIGTVVRFVTNAGTWDTELLDIDAPLTVQNFLTYVNSTAYDNLIVHRSDPGFIIQGGGYKVSGGVPGFVTTNPAIQNEFNAANSNVRGTLAMALPSGNINGGTSQWFFNTGNNSALDSGKYTVFGRVIGTGMSVVDQINAITPRNLSSLYGDSALNELPLRNAPPTGTPLTGTVSVINGTTTVNGIDTLFTTELQVGTSILLDGEAFVVQSIESDTSLTVTAPTLFTMSNLTASKNVLPQDSDFVIFSNIGEILAVI